MSILTRFWSLLKRANYTLIFLAISLIPIGIFLVPAFLPQALLEIIYKDDISSHGDSLINAIKDKYSDQKIHAGKEVIQLSPLVIGLISYNFIKTEAGYKFASVDSVDRQIDYQNLSTALIVIAFTSMTIHLLSRSGSDVVTADSTLPQQKRKDTFEMCISETTVEDALLIETKNAWLAARQFYGNSIYLLASGVLAAVGGILFFYFAVKDVPPETKDGIWLYLLSTIRPLGMLIFIEAIAWFLLRQYRSSIEDYKNFHRIYLRRSNYFIARRAFSEIATLEKSKKIAQALLDEDLSGRLSAGQTTEAIEAMKMDENNPVFKVLSDALARATGKGKEDKEKKSEEKPKDQKTE